MQLGASYMKCPASKVKKEASHTIVLERRDHPRPCSEDAALTIFSGVRVGNAAASAFYDREGQDAAAVRWRVVEWAFATCSPCWNFPQLEVFDPQEASQAASGEPSVFLDTEIIQAARSVSASMV